MAGFLTSSSVSLNNGSNVVNVTGSVDCSFVVSGTAVYINDMLMEGVSGTASDPSGNSTITLRNVHTGTSIVGGTLVAFNTIEGLRDAIQRARDLSAQFQEGLGDITHTDTSLKTFLTVLDPTTTITFNNESTVVVTPYQVLVDKVTAQGLADNVQWKEGKSVSYSLDDLQGFTDELFAQAGIVPSGQPDKLGASQRVDAINHLINFNQKIKFNSVQDMKSLVGSSGKSVTLSEGDLVSTGITDWRVVPSSVGGGFLIGGFKVIPLNGAWIADWKIDLTGVVPADTEFSDAASLNGTIMLSSGLMRLDTKQTVGTNVKIHGFGPECGIDAQMTDVVFEFPRETGRSVKVWRGFHLISTGNVMTNGVAFLLPGSQIGGALQYTSGYKFEDIEIGGGGQFGCGWDVSDTFRLTIRDCGYSLVTVPVRIHGSVVQCTIDNLTGNNDSFSRLYKGKNVGVIMLSRNDYADAVTRVPENIKILNSGFVLHQQGIESLGLAITCQNCDLDYIRDVGWSYGGGDGHRLIGGYIASSSQNFPFVGVSVTRAQTLNQVEIDGVTINSYVSVASKQTAVQVGSGDAAPHLETAGVSVTNIIVTGPASSWDFGVQADRNISVEISSNRFAPRVIKTGGKAINASNQKNLTCNSNKCSGQEIYITAPDATATITAVDNNATVVTAFIAPPAANVEIARNRASVG